MSKYTPGPWILKPTRSSGRWYLLDAANTDKVLAVLETTNSTVARQVAAAPDLLAFAKRMEEYFLANQTGYQDLYEQCVAAVRKAEGDTNE